MTHRAVATPADGLWRREAEQPKSLQDEIESRVFISIPDIPTVEIGALEDAIFQVEIGLACPAAVTELTTWVKPIDFDQQPTPALDLAFQQIQQCAHSGVGEGSRQAAIADQSLDMQILNPDDP